MKKSIVAEFPDDFIFPATFKENVCIRCLFMGFDANETEICFLTGDADYPLFPSKIKCPFFDGDDIIYME